VLEHYVLSLGDNSMSRTLAMRVVLANHETNWGESATGVLVATSLGVAVAMRK
jgi:hypothetical protein